MLEAKFEHDSLDIGFEESEKICLNLRSWKCLRFIRSRIMNLITLALWQS